ncbi:MAG TPA: response regulator transcription factor [Phycisphaerales bacterium]|nr:response regulator transcription factor [Phycisphaerales bacterium]
MTPGEPITVLCADDNEQVGLALRHWLSRAGRYVWLGHLLSADHLVHEVQRLRPRIVLLDLDMPGAEPLATLGELSKVCPDARVVVFTGHVRLDLIERTMEAGGWGYVSKNDGERHLTAAIEAVLQGELYMSPEAHGMLAGPEHPRAAEG